MRTLEYIPGGYFEIILTLTAPAGARTAVEHEILESFDPAVLRKSTNVRQTDLTRVDFKHSDTKASWPGNYCTLSFIFTADSTQLQLGWTPGNIGATEALTLFDRALESPALTWSGVYYVGGDGYGIQNSGALTAGQMKRMLGTSHPVWKLNESQVQALEYFTVDTTDGVTFKQII